MLPQSLHYLYDDVIVKIFLACLLCGLIGLERQWRQKAAGFRTHLLVGLGSTMFTLVSIHGFAGPDPSRVAAQIVSGIGFIGGGAILRHGLSVRGVTTAATLWLVAAIGMSVAVGWYEPALVATGMALLTLILLTNLEAFLPALPMPMQVLLKVTLDADQQTLLQERFAAHAWVVRRGALATESAGKVRLTFTIRRIAGTEKDLDALMMEIQTLRGLTDLSWEVMESVA
jgi:putative Mg2+ transporter-C (MgtC) family protein